MMKTLLLMHFYLWASTFGHMPVLSLSISSSSSTSQNPDSVFKIPCKNICRYNQNFFDGKVCIGCFRDLYEIRNWGIMSTAEKGYALEDCIDRYDENFEGSISLNELRKQARFWSEYDMRVDSVAGSNSKVEETSKTVKQILNDTVSGDEAVDFPVTPCTRICRYNADFFDGNICIGCFRDVHEISNWSSMSPKSKIYALEDAADRSQVTGKLFEGAITSRELLRQAKNWRKFSDNNDENMDKLDNKVINNEILEWSEICIKTQERKTFKPSHNNKHHDYTDFMNGDSVIILPQIISSEDCEVIINETREIANRHRASRFSKGLLDEGIVRIPTINAASRAAKNTTPCAEAMDAKTDKLINHLLGRVFELLDESNPLILSQLFPQKQLSLSELFLEDKLAFSSREPAVNVYNKGGKFRPHEDGQKLTVLITLSNMKNFEGGGTGFWPQHSRGHRVEAPTLKLQPLNCGVPVLFTGQVTHSGLEVTNGERVVFVASFSPIL